MKWSEQGTQNAPYVVVPRTLSFLLYGEELLLLRGAAHKRLWAGKLNGVGGHVEPGEDILASARREVSEETGLAVADLRLRAVIHIAGPEAPGVLLFIYLGTAPTRTVRSSHEGALEWHPLAALPWGEMVSDLSVLLPRLLAHREGVAILYGVYGADDSGAMAFHVDDGATDMGTMDERPSML